MILLCDTILIMKKENVVFKLEPKIRLRLTEIASSESRSLSSVIRQAILEFLKRRKK